MPIGADELSFWRRDRFVEIAASLPMLAWLCVEIAVSIVFLFDDTRREPPLTTLTRLSSLVSAVILMMIYCLRAPTVRKAAGVWPRLFALLGFAAPLLVLALPPAELSSTARALAACGFLLGSVATILSLLWLGRSFSIFPQARELVTSGPYRYVRHPIYLAELVMVWSGMWGFRQPGALLVALLATGLQIVRMRMEERVLRDAFPAYAAYSQRTARLIPGLF